MSGKVRKWMRTAKKAEEKVQHLETQIVQRDASTQRPVLLKKIEDLQRQHAAQIEGLQRELTKAKEQLDKAKEQSAG
jgi:cell shape-determining protein MreC